MEFTQALGNSRRVAVTALFVAMVTLAGCGGASSGGGSLESGASAGAASRQIRGTASVTLQWPARGSAIAGKLIPVAANSATVAFLNPGGAVVQSQLLVRPQATAGSAGLQTTAAFTNLPAGALNVAVEAYATNDGSGVAVAQGSTAVAIVAGETTPVSLTLASTIVAVSISPNALPGTTTAPTVLTATATDSANNIVVTSQWQWTSSNPAVFSLVPAGATATIAPISAGSSTITATETESGKSASVIATATSY